MNDIIPLLQAFIYIIIAIMMGMVGLYFYFLNYKTRDERRKKRREGLHYDTSTKNNIEEENNVSSKNDDDPIKFV